MPIAVALSQWIGVVGCRCPILVRVRQKQILFGNCGKVRRVQILQRKQQQIALWLCWHGKPRSTEWLHLLLASIPWKNAHMLCCRLFCWIDMKRWIVYSLSYPRCGIVSSLMIDSWGKIQQINAQAHCFSVSFICLAAIKLRAIKLSYPLWGHNTRCFRGSFRPAWYLSYWALTIHRGGEELELQSKCFWVQVSIDMIAMWRACHVCIPAVSFWCTPSLICPPFVICSLNPMWWVRFCLLNASLATAQFFEP